MLPSDPIAAPETMNSPSADLVQVGEYATEQDAFDHGLVVLAMGRAYWLSHDDTRHRLFVESDAVERAREQLLRFDAELKHWRRDVPEAPPAPIDFLPAVIWATVLLAAFWAQARWPQLTALGALDAEGVLQRAEWWRPFTALFLHADADHILANLAAGLFIFSAALSTFGRLRGIAAIAAASVAANAVLAILGQSTAYRSIGASTAVFAALGALTGRAICRAAGTRRPHRWRAVFVPLAASATTLALYGAGGQNVDLGAHAVGFALGGIAGWIATRSRREIR